jgi:dihydrofolate reductase
MPNLDENPEWKKVGESDEQTYFDLEYYFLKYEKVK